MPDQRIGGAATQGIIISTIIPHIISELMKGEKILQNGFNELYVFIILESLESVKRNMLFFKIIFISLQFFEDYHCLLRLESLYSDT